MKNTVLIDLQDYVKRHHKLILLSMIAVVVCFGFQAFSFHIRIDTEELQNNPGSTLGWLKIGRYGLVLLKRILGLSTHHAIKSGVLFLLFFCAGLNLLTFSFYHFSKRSEQYPYWIFVLLCGTSSIWSYQVYFSLQQAEVALAMLFIILAALLSVRACFVSEGKFNWVRLLISTIFLIIGFGSYQALAAYYITICIAFFLVHLRELALSAGGGLGVIKRGDQKRLIFGICKLIAHFVLAYVLYSWIANTWFMSSGAYMEGQMGWGRLTLWECVKNVLRTIKNVVLFYGPRNVSFYSIGVLLLLPAGWTGWKYKEHKSGFSVVLFFLAVAGMCISPFLMTIYMGEMLVARSQFALPVAAAFLGMYTVGILSSGNLGKKRVMRLCTVGVLSVTVIQAGYNLQLAYTDSVRYHEDIEVTEQVIQALERKNGGSIPEIPIIFVGYRVPELNALCARTEMYGWSFYEWDYSVGNPTGATHRIAGFIEAYTGVELCEDISDEMKWKAVDLAKQMPDFPNEGAIKTGDGFIVVRLSEIKERTDLDWW